MAQAARKIDPNLKPLSDSLNSSLASETARVSDTLANSLGGSRLAGEGFKKINDKIQDIGEQMSQVLADELTGQELLKDAGMLALVIAANELNNEDNKKNLADSIKEGAQNIDPNEAINDFGNSALPENKSVAEQIAEHETKQAANDNVETPPVAANDNVENQPHDRLQAGMDRTKEKSEAAKKAALNPNALNTAQAANDNTENDPKSEPGAVDNPLPIVPPPEPTDNSLKSPQTNPPQNQKQPDQPHDASTTAAQQKNPEQPNEPEPKPAEKKAIENLDKKEPENTEPKPEKPEENSEEKKEEAQPQPEPAVEPEPETNPIDQALNEAGLPLVDTDEDNPMLPKKTEIEKAAEQAKQQESAQTSENNQPDGNAPQSTEGEDPENPNTPPQPGQKRGKITQGVNYLRNRGAISDIEKEIKQLEPKLRELKKEIKQINDKIKPIERKITLLRIAYWSLFIVEIFLRLLAVVLAITIVFLIFFPLAEMVWAASSVPQGARLAMGKEIDKLKETIEDEKKKKEKKEKELKKYQNEIKNLAIQRYNLMNQSLLRRGDQNTPTNT